MIEQYFRSRNILKFEGIQTRFNPLSREAKYYQIGHVLTQLARYAEAPHIALLKYKNWSDVFYLIADLIKKGKWILYFEEVQWLANYQSEFFAELKPVWDNQLRHNKKLVLVFCGSSPSFIVNELVSNKAFYNRSQYEIDLKPFRLPEMAAFLGKRRSPSEIMLAALVVGGIPEYLKRLKSSSSVYLSLCKESFLPRSFFSIEKNKIFVSSLKSNKHFEKVIQFLSQRKYSTRDEIAGALKKESSGKLTRLLDELEACSFIEKYTPAHLDDSSIVSRYTIADPYLQFYFKFIAPNLRSIQNGDYEKDPTIPLKGDAFQKWLGFSFERFCRQYRRVFAKILGFEAVQYRAGAFFKRGHMSEKKGFQIDLIYFRSDHVVTICEIKYYDAKVGPRVIDEVERKIAHLKEAFPKVQRETFHKVLITIEGADKSLQNRGYFDDIITLRDFFDERSWD